jgi:hypothetical protein
MDKRWKRPMWLMGGVAFIACWCVAQALISTGIFLFWREGERSEFFPLGPTDGVPNVAIWQSGLLLWLVSTLVLWGVGPLFWEFQSFLFCVIIITVYFCAIVAVFGLSIVVWYVPAILIGVGALFVLYIVVAMWVIYGMARTGKDGWFIGDGHTAAAIEANHSLTTEKSDYSKRTVTPNSDESVETRRSRSNASGAAPSSMASHNRPRDQDYYRRAEGPWRDNSRAPMRPRGGVPS